MSDTANLFEQVSNILGKDNRGGIMAKLIADLLRRESKNAKRKERDRIIKMLQGRRLPCSCGCGEALEASSVATVIRFGAK